MSIEVVLLLGLVILVAHLLEGITGFGCSIIALPFSIALVGIKTTVPMLTVLGWVIAAFIVITDRKNVNIKEFVKILSFVLLGLPLGMYFYSYLPEEQLKMLLGVVMILISVKGLFDAFSKKVKAQNNTEIGVFKKGILYIYLFIGGIVHGAFSSGGALVILYASKKLKDKSEFRATLSALWLTLNSIIIIRYFINGVVTFEIGFVILKVVPFFIVGMIIGNIVHKKLQPDIFVKLVYTVLFISGIFMF
jgi:hypothetical protein